MRIIPRSERSTFINHHEEYLKSTTEKSSVINYAGVEVDVNPFDHVTSADQDDKKDASVQLSFQRVFTGVQA